MRQVEEDMLIAIKERKYMKKQNTVVTTLDVDSENYRINVQLHGHLIAQVFPRGNPEIRKPFLYISHCGYVTRTTTSRLNEIIRACTLSRGCFMSYDSLMVYLPPNSVHDLMWKHPSKYEPEPLKYVNQTLVEMSSTPNAYLHLPLKEDF